MDLLDRLQAQLDGGRDSALLRLSLGQALLARDELEAAIAHLRAALAQDPHYSAAWKTLGTALQRRGDLDGAAQAWTRGIEVAAARGDLQAQREMRVFLRRLGGDSG